jgi:hypothetical protein
VDECNGDDVVVEGGGGTLSQESSVGGGSSSTVSNKQLDTSFDIYDDIVEVNKGQSEESSKVGVTPAAAAAAPTATTEQLKTPSIDPKAMTVSLGLGF